MQVEHHVRRVDDRPQGASAVQFEGVARAVEGGAFPHPVHILLCEARGGGVGGIEAREGVQIGEDQAERAAERRQALALPTMPA